VLLGEQRDKPEDICQRLPPGSKTEFPFVIPVTPRPLAALVGAEIYAENYRGRRHGNYYFAEKVVEHAPSRQANSTS
jgi:hypothetical protein